jgi:glycerophosphoryl diester phosphodiesterase
MVKLAVGGGGMTKIISHRGAFKYAPQNTIPAFLKAFEIGANGIEFDVQMTKDNELVICHDYTIDETSNGKGKIKDFTLNELKNFDFGVKYPVEFKNTKIPTLKEVLEIANKFEIINIEIKSQAERNEEIVKKVIDCVKSNNFTGDVIYSSFDFEVLKIMQKLDDTLKLGALFTTADFSRENKARRNIEKVKANSFQAIHPNARFLRQQYVEECHKNNIMVNCWGANSAKKIGKMFDAGCDLIITDEVERAVQIIQS